MDRPQANHHRRNLSLLFLFSIIILVMAVAISSMRSQAALLTRSWLVTPPSFNYRAGKSSRIDIAVAYSCFADLPLRRSLDPYKIQTRSISSSTARSAASSTSSSAIPHISLHIAASSSGKKKKFDRALSTYDFEPSNDKALGLQRGSNKGEKRRNRPDSGEDAYFAARVGKDQPVIAFGIADGVGGWNEHGVDPADFSHGLCSYMASTSLNWTNFKPPSPVQLLSIAYNSTISDPEIEAGGSPACVAIADADGRMRIANLGDSGFLQLRLGTVHHYSNPQTHAFNTPYQMSLTPPKILAQAKIFGSVPLNDDPSKADLADHMLRHGDVLVLATDGVWDNLDSQDILRIVSQHMRDSGAWQKTEEQGYVVSDKIGSLVRRGEAEHAGLEGTLQSVLAAAIVAEAKTASHDQKRDGPFAKGVQKAYPGEPWHGGKVDDIAVLVVVPTENTVGGKLKAKL